MDMETCAVHETDVTVPAAVGQRKKRKGSQLCLRGYGGRKCACCDIPIPPREFDESGQGEPGGPAAAPWSASGFLRPGPLGSTPPPAAPAFVDTHCHLEEVLQMVRRHTVAPSLGKETHEFTAEELTHWRTLGWIQDGDDDCGEPGEAQQEDVAVSKSEVWERFWAELSPRERNAAAKLGYSAEAWDRNQWLLPRRTAWSELDQQVQQSLEVLGETPSSWDTWNTNNAAGATIVNCNDLRRWSWLSGKERRAAAALGFTEQTWNSEELADVSDTVDNLFGTSFEGCVTQGCDTDSVDFAQSLALSHPKVYASFGCHPKAAWMYDDEFEQQLLDCMKTCGPKAVAWGEFGLDYSHDYYGKLAENRRVQKDVFARQLRLAIGNGFNLVIHSRRADRDTLRILRRFVPRHWKVHVHSFRGSMSFMRAVLAEWDYAFIGIPGIVTMRDPDAQELARQCPLDRMVLETDAPYLPVQSTYFSHPGQIPEITAKVAELKGVSVDEVALRVRENARIMYGV